MRLASVQGCLVESGWDGCCRPIKQTTTKLRCCILRMRLEADLGGRKNDLRSAQLGWVIPPGGSRLGPPEKRGEATELAEMIFTGGGRPGGQSLLPSLPERTEAHAGKPFIICQSKPHSCVRVRARVRVRSARAALGLLNLEAARGRPSCLARSLISWLHRRFGGVRVCVSALRLLRCW